MRIWICPFPSIFLLSFLSHSMASHVDECEALLQFSNSFTISADASSDYCDHESSITSYPKTSSWKNDTGCCSWDGVTCHPATNHVAGLDLSCSRLQGPLHSHSTLFSLSKLRHLNLAGNNFSGSRISPRFGIFKGMKHLILSYSVFSGPIPQEISHLSSLITLDLSGNGGLIGDRSFGWLILSLPQLRELVLDGVNMSRISLVSLTNLSSTLTSLSLHDCDLRGVFPIDIFRLPNLQSLSLSSNSFLMGTLPRTNWTNPLVSLELSYTNFHGSIPASLGNLTYMSHLDLSNSGFSGAVPPTLGNLEYLTHLDLSDNNLTGTVDFEIFALLKNLQQLSLVNNNLTVLLQDDGNCSFPRLRFLYLYGCRLTKFPYFLRSSTELKELDLSGNMITGRIPEWFWSVVRDTLTDLILSSNNFTGDISSSICQLTSPHLYQLDLSNNRLTGTIPECLGNLSSLYKLQLSGNQLQGPLPRSLASCTSMRTLNVSYNAIYDTFPSWLANATFMRFLDFQSNKFHGIIEVHLPPLLSYFSISKNNFSGQLPINFLLHSELIHVDMANNNFDSPLPIPPHTVRFYLLSNNKFHGGITQVCNTTDLYIINLFSNSLTGTIPHCFINISASLRVLDLRGNKLSGKIPEIFIPETKLQTIRLSQNQLGGTLPQSLVHCKNLEILDLNENKLEGSFPYWLDALPNLHVLTLSTNMFHGPVDSSSANAHPFPKLRILDVCENSFSGPLPARYLANLNAMKNEDKGGLQYMGLKIYEDTFYQDSITVVVKGNEIELERILTIFSTVDFSSNFFEGEIPEVIGDLKALKGLNLSYNNLEGKIPSSIGNLTNLEWLDLSSNKLNGKIPRELAALSSLSCLNLSHNQLMGPIPQSTQFDTFSQSFDGNPGLCGSPLPKACGNGATTGPSTSHGEEEKESGKWIEWRAVPMGYGCGLVFGISAGYIMLETRTPRWLARMVEQKSSRKTNRPESRNHGRRSARGQ